MGELRNFPEKNGDVVDLERFRERRDKAWAEASIIPESRISLVSRLVSRLSPLAIMESLRSPKSPEPVDPTPPLSVEEVVEAYTLEHPTPWPIKVVHLRNPDKTQ